MRKPLLHVVAYAVIITAAWPAGAQPTNDGCATPTVIAALPFHDLIDTSAATTDAADPLQSCGLAGPAQNSNSVWYRFTAPGNGAIRISTAGSDYDTLLTIYTGGCGALSEVVCNDDAGGSLQSEVFFNVSSGTTYIAEVTDFGQPGGGALEFDVQFFVPPPGSDACASPEVVSAIPFSQTLVTSGATSEATDPVQQCTGQTNSNTVWYSYTPPGSGTVTVSTAGSSYDTVLSIYTGACGSLQQIGCNDDDPAGGIQSLLSVPVSAGTTYLIEASDLGTPGGGALVFTLNFKLPPTPAPLLSPAAGLVALAVLLLIMAARLPHTRTRLTKPGDPPGK